MEPILETDLPVTLDELDRQKFADQIVHSLLTSFDKVEDSIVVGICGRWGSGKTTLLNFIECELYKASNELHAEYKILKFNPWSISGTNNIEQSLLETLLNNLESINWKTRLRKVNHTFKDRLKYFKHLDFIGAFSSKAKFILDALEKYRNDNSDESIQKLKSKINSAIEQSGYKTFIIIDDLDRLEPEEILAIFRMIKMNVNFVNTYFLVAYDKHVVVNLLKAKFADNASQYLEKIIQVDFHIPEILGEQIERVFLTKLEKITKRLKIPYKEREITLIWRYHGLKEYFNTLRDIKRYFNTLFLSLPNIARDIHLSDFLVVQAIKVFDFRSYEQLIFKLHEIRRLAVWQSAGFSEQVIGEFDNSITKALLEYLFTTSQNSLSLGKGQNKKQVRDPNYYERYFSLNIPSSDVNESALTRFFLHNSNRSAILKELTESGKIKNFLARISDKELGKYYTLDDKKLFKDFLNFWNSYSDYLESFDELIWKSYFNLAHSFINKYDGAKISVEGLILTTSDIQHATFIFNHFFLLFEERGDSDPHLYGVVLDQLVANKAKMRDRFDQYLLHYASSYLIDIERGQVNYATNLFIYSLAKNQQTTYLEKIKPYHNSPSFVLFLVKKNFVMYDKDSGDPGRLNLQHRETFLPGALWNSFLMAAQNINKSSLEHKDQKILTYFLRALG